MGQQKEELLNQVQEFKDTFNEYFEAFMEYLNGGIIKDSEYTFGHPTLFTLSNKLQVAYLQLPEYLQKRLLDLEFNVFLHCNNIVDFFSLRIFLIEKQRFHGTSTIAVRVDSELNLAKMLIEKDIWEEYSKLPKRNFHFYRGQLQPKIMDELKLQFEKDLQNKQQEEKAISESENSSGENKELTNEGNGFFNDTVGKIEKTEAMIGSADSIVGKTLNLIKTLTSIGKYL
ncbi:hypothetical protein JUJ52_09925 [Virgibacillus sp. AGTR]|uniref:hypothetical protein n=1 Tax=Virgibacillus sp. AGTR TaxID=2812055 RepID=UPI001D16BBE6|nr:hypothetical protein [Virgibacillus sp. AGTR]MCC2250284.1 hypothetical protein [Virgibacillus sp. AGTR]